MKLKSVLNFRDVGGIPSNGNGNIIEGQIYRSATVDNINNEDILRFRDFGIRT
ncbi:MAG: tyrosine-protein phosphatase, partial [Bacteroidia bacterium]|nr:tyrosine-protein phosphatase [Bacteroidia bacterium]